MTKIKKPQQIERPTWLKYSEDEVRSIIHKLAENGLTSEKIGLVLRDQYGIPKSKIFGIKIKSFLGEKFQEPTIIHLEKKLEKVINHYKKNKQDKRAEHSLIITRAKLKKRESYHKESF